MTDTYYNADVEVAGEDADTKEKVVILSQAQSQYILAIIDAGLQKTIFKPGDLYALGNLTQTIMDQVTT